MRIILVIILSVVSIVSKSQVSYSGFIDKYPILLVTYIYSDGEVKAIYAYDKYDSPILINGTCKGHKLKLHERNDKNEITATLNIENFDLSNTSESNKNKTESLSTKKNANLIGTWNNSNSSKKLSVTLKKDFDIDNDADFKEKEIIQSASALTHYFKLIITKTDGNARVSGVKIFEKKTDRLIQKIDLDCQLLGLDNISTGDYNFDGLEDFSVFESSYAGPNTSSIYILRNSDSDQYTVSDFSGTSLEFDKDLKLIYEHNESSAGRSIMNATYKVIDNKMILVGKKCLEYDDEKEEFHKIECE